MNSNTNETATTAEQAPAWLTLSDASKLMRGRGGKRPSIETLRRWANAKKGCRPSGEGGPVIYLQVTRVNGELLTTAEWVHEFERERVRLGTRERPPFLGRTDRQRERAYKRACERLDAQGVGVDPKPSTMKQMETRRRNEEARRQAAADPQAQQSASAVNGHTEPQ